MAEVDSQQFRSAMSHFCTGVVVATACLNGEPVGFAAQSFVSLSLDPPLVALCPAKTSTSWPKIREAGHFCINMLSASQQSICDAFARSGGDKFAGLEWQPGVTGSPVLRGILAYADCVLDAEHDAGDHTVAIGRVHDVQIVESGKPLLFFGGDYGTFGSHTSE